MIEFEVLKEILLDIKHEHCNSLEASSVINDIWHEVREYIIERNK